MYQILILTLIGVIVGVVGGILGGGADVFYDSRKPSPFFDTLTDEQRRELFESSVIVGSKTTTTKGKARSELSAIEKKM